VVEEKKAEVVAPVAEPAPAPLVAEPVAPAAAVEKTEPAAPASTTYVVQEGDDMTGVSIRWGVSAAEIRELNNMAEGDQLVPGQIIKLPADAQQ
jgi:LysM repeat protein